MNKKNHNQLGKFFLRALLLSVIVLIICSLVLSLVFKKNNHKSAEVIKDDNVLSVISPTIYDQPLVVSMLNYILRISPINANGVQAVWEGTSIVKYQDAYKNTDVEQIQYPNKLKESLILKSPGHPNKFEYIIDIKNYSWEFDGDGNIIISSRQGIIKSLSVSDGSEVPKESMHQYIKETGKILKIPQPFMIEQGGVERGEVVTEIIDDRLVLTPDKEWLATHRYPIVIDPTIEKVPQMVEELAEKRSYNSVTFLNDDGSFTTMAHVGDINYQDKTGKFKPVDTTLKNTGNGWQQNKASYNSVFPEYADEWLEFENMYESGGTLLKMKPVADHAFGRLITDEGDEWHDKKVVYSNAFGVGNDLELIAGNIALFKLVKLNHKPEDLSQDVEFDFELALQPEEKLIINGQEWNGVDEVLTSEQIGIAINGGNTTYLRKFTVWDNQDRSEPITIKISSQNSKIYFTKILSKDFLANAEYPVYTDASVSYYTGAADGSIYTSAYTDWATARAASDGDGVSNTRIDREYARSEFVDPEYEIFRLFLPINTADLDDSAVISAATLNLYGGYVRTWDNDGYDYSVIVQTSQASNTLLATADFDQVGSTAGSATYDTSVLTEGGWNTLALNATGLTWISKTGYTKLGIREGHDMENHAPVAKITHEYGISESAYGPYISITYNANPTATTVTDTPDPTNPGRSVSFIYDWNDSVGDLIKIKVCKTNSLTNQNCDGGYWASSTNFTTMDPTTAVYDVVAGDAGNTRDYWAFACDDGGLCTTGTAGTFSVNSQSTVPNIKVRGGLKVR